MAAAGGTVAAGWGNAALTAVAVSSASGAAVSTINNRGNLGAVLKDVTSEEALKGYAVGAVTAGLTAGVFDKWTSTETGANAAGAATGNTGALANSGAVVTAGGLSSWSGVGKRGQIYFSGPVREVRCRQAKKGTDLFSGLCLA